MRISLALFAVALSSALSASAQQFSRLGACPELACIFPPSSAAFVPGAYFDLRVEVHAPGEGPNQPPGTANGNFTVTITGDDGKALDANEFFGTQDPALEQWNFSYHPDMAAYWATQDGTKTEVNVNVASRIWRKVFLPKAGEYTVRVTYNGNTTTEAKWEAKKPVYEGRKAKNAIFFIGDGMNTATLTAARLISRPRVSGRYQRLLTIDQMDHLGHIMTHSMDSLITDSANSASAYHTGHKTNVNALGVYADSSESPFDDPKHELLAELLRRRPESQGGKLAIGIVTTAEVQDATPAAVFSHVRRRGEKAAITEQFVRGAGNFTEPIHADVYMGGGGKYFHNNTDGKSLNGQNYYDIFRNELGYAVVHDKHELANYTDSKPLLGIFHQGNMDVWMDRNVYPENLKGQKSDPRGNGQDAVNQPNLGDMALKALEVLKKRSGDNGFFLMVEAASVDKMMHHMDFDRGLAEALELDSTVNKTINWLRENKELDDTLIVVTADHAHSFDVFGSVDTQYFNSLPDSDDSQQQAMKRRAVGVYEFSGWPDYVDADGDGFPDNWRPRFTLAAGPNNFPTHNEDYQLSEKQRVAAVMGEGANAKNFIANPKDDPHGLHFQGDIPTHEGDSVHTLQDVPVFSRGPGSELFSRPVIDNTEVYFAFANALGVADLTSVSKQAPKKEKPAEKKEEEKKEEPTASNVVRRFLSGSRLFSFGI
ncbi:uncharacterized protein VTP21DRAFT_4736 [Calcarisporiella thermophila]|uniref:uncharacterized protein n=1 Tax=Calcarisporiella thermophila TaxID=911321 RepID=UPI003743BE47